MLGRRSLDLPRHLSENPRVGVSIPCSFECQGLLHQFDDVRRIEVQGLRRELTPPEELAGEEEAPTTKRVFISRLYQKERRWQ